MKRTSLDAGRGDTAGTSRLGLRSCAAAGESATRRTEQVRLVPVRRDMPPLIPGLGRFTLDVVAELELHDRHTAVLTPDHAIPLSITAFWKIGVTFFTPSFDSCVSVTTSSSTASSIILMALIWSMSTPVGLLTVWPLFSFTWFSCGFRFGWNEVIFGDSPYLSVPNMALISL